MVSVVVIVKVSRRMVRDDVRDKGFVNLFWEG